MEYKRKSKKGRITIVRRKDGSKHLLIGAAVLGGGILLGTAALLASKRSHYDTEGVLKKLRQTDDLMNAKHAKNMQFLDDIKAQNQAVRNQSEYYQANPKQHPVYREARENQMRDWGYKPGQGIGNFAMGDTYQRRSRSGRLGLVRKSQSKSLIDRYKDWHSKEKAKTKIAMAKIHRDRIRKYGDLGRLDKLFYDDLTLGQFT